MSKDDDFDSFCEVDAAGRALRPLETDPDQAFRVVLAGVTSFSLLLAMWI
jgi:hypothetical protein